MSNAGWYRLWSAKGFLGIRYLTSMEVPTWAARGYLITPCPRPAF